MNSTNQLQNLLQQVSIINRKYQEITAITGEHFNLFSIMRMETSEDWTHSAIITELLSSNGSHGQGNKFIKIFIDYVNQHILQKDEEKDPITLFNQCLVKLKKRIGTINDDYTTGGEIDIYIEEGDKCIIIENKIYAKDQKNQLLRYHNYGNRKKKCWLFYLTLDKKLPDDYITGSDEGVKKKVIPISYKEHILAWLELCKREVADYPLIRESLTQYINLLKKLTNQATNKKMESEIVKAIISSTDSLSAAFDISRNIEYIYDPLLDVLKKQLKEKAEILGFKTEDHDWGNSTRTSPDAYYYFNLPDTKYGTYIALGFDEKNCVDFSIGIYSDDKILNPGTEKYLLLQREITKRLEFIGECETDTQEKYLYVCYKPTEESLIAWHEYDIWMSIPSGETAEKLIGLVKAVYENIKDLEL
jgi:hypothetical protein